MFDSLVKKVHKKLYSYSFFQKAFDVLERTPTYAVHWYLLMLLGIIIVLVSVGLAWMAFRNASLPLSDEFSNTVTATTIHRDALQDVLDSYKVRKVELEGLKQSEPTIIDPGR